MVVVNKNFDFSFCEQVLVTAKELVKATGYLFEIIENPDQKFIKTEQYVRMVRLHNAAVDYIVSMKNIKNKEV